MEWIFIIILIVSIVHVIEEYFGGFVDQMKRFVPDLDLANFASVNMTFIILSFIAVIVGSASLIYSLSISALLFINALFHIGGAIRLKGYGAGLISALVLYIPVSIYAYSYYWNTGALTQVDFILSVVLGVIWMIMAFVHQFLQIYIKNAKNG
jgi:hypothetical protein